MEITKIKVVTQDTATSFEAVLQATINQFQKEGLIVIINNPHLVYPPNGMYNYIAVVEGRTEVNITRLRDLDHKH